MARIHTSHKNASENINGIKFTRDQHGAISEEVPLERAAMFADIPGFKVIPSPSDAKPEPAPANMVKLDGAAGTLYVGGDYSPEDLAALRELWEDGHIPVAATRPIMLHGPKGTLAVGGDPDADDIEALRKHWVTGTIHDPAPNLSADGEVPPVGGSPGVEGQTQDGTVGSEAAGAAIATGAATAVRRRAGAV